MISKQSLVIAISSRGFSLIELLCSQLKTTARSIYNTYLSDSAPYSVNIDDTAKTEEKDLKQPTPDMFNKAQAQVWTPHSHFSWVIQ